MKYKLSVIIPVYNAQNTIKRCIDSVINQTIGFSNIELILYDDKSTDNTREILNEYSNKYNNIILILSNENSGYPGKGRNEGIKRATADYIMFMDNDDEYNADICETLYNEIINENADIVSCDSDNISENHHEIISGNFNGTTCTDNKITFLAKDRFRFLDPIVWNKIFKKSTIINNNVQFPNGISEDIYFTSILLIYVNKIVYLKNYVGYKRYIQNNSISYDFLNNHEKIDQDIDVHLKIVTEYKEGGVQNHDPKLANIVAHLLSLAYAGILLEDKKKTKNLLNSIYSIQKENTFDDSYLYFPNRIANRLILKKRFNLAIAYLKILRLFYNNSFFKRIYRILNQ